MYNPLIYGKDSTEKIVNISHKDNNIFVYYSDKRHDIIPVTHWFLSNVYLEKGVRLKGNQTFSYANPRTNWSDLYDELKDLERDEIKTWKPRTAVEGYLLRSGKTYYKGMSLKDVSVLSFDIETTGVTIDKNSHVLLISNTYRDRHGKITKKLFSFDEYDKSGDFILDWCRWVRQMDPDIITGHNIFGFDIPYLDNFARNNGVKLFLGRDASPLYKPRNESKFRKDGSQSYDFFNYECFGREIIDTMFLSIKYDIGRKYESYALKKIISFEGLEKKDRQHYDASLIRVNFTNPSEWIKIKEYAKDDADDALSLFDLMAPSYFYYTQYLPMGFQKVINSATGSQVNSIMVRSYIQDGYSIPEAEKSEDFEGAISIGNPGIYHNVYKVDVASLYPSIMLQYNVTDTRKDYLNHFISIVDMLTKERLLNKELGATSSYHKQLSEAQKIVINSAYGFMGASGLNFNYPKGAAFVTEKGREFLNIAIQWAERNSFKIVNADTDSISFSNGLKQDLSALLIDLNSLFPTKIRWTDDGYYESFIVFKAKNYAMLSNGKIKIKGSALKATGKEKRLQKFIKECIAELLSGGTIDHLYGALILEVGEIKDISEWCSKKTVTETLLCSDRTNETRLVEAIKGQELRQGDKFFVFFEDDNTIRSITNFNGKYDKKRLYGKAFDTLKIFQTVIDIKQFTNYKLLTKYYTLHPEEKPIKIKKAKAEKNENYLNN